MFILTVDMTTYPVTKYYYIIERIYFIYRMFILFISTLSFLLFYIIMEAYERLSPCQYKYCFILCSILLTRWRNIRLFYATFLFTIKKVPIWTWPTHSTICSYAHGYPLTKLSHWNVELSFITHIDIATLYISSLMSNFMLERWFSALLIRLLVQKCYGSHCIEMFFECSVKSFFRNFH